MFKLVSWQKQVQNLLSNITEATCLELSPSSETSSLRGLFSVSTNAMSSPCRFILIRFVSDCKKDTGIKKYPARWNTKTMLKKKMKHRHTFYTKGHLIKKRFNFSNPFFHICDFIICAQFVMLKVKVHVSTSICLNKSNKWTTFFSVNYAVQREDESWIKQGCVVLTNQLETAFK